MTVRLFRKPANWFEPFMTLFIAAGLVRAVLYFLDHSYLPQPFFFDPFDTWMDWFNPAFWAHEPGRYEGWGSVYPPLSFVFLRIFSLSKCYAYGADPYAVRGCDWIGIVTLFSFYALNVFLFWKTFKRIDPRTAFWRTAALSMGLPTITGLERGNLIVVCTTAFILGFGPLLKSARLRWIAAGLAINFKIYLVSGLAARLLRRQWLWFEGAMVATIAIYLITLCLLGDGTPQQIYENITAVSAGRSALTLTDLWTSVTYNGFLTVLDSQYLLLSGHLGTRNIDLISFIIPILINTSKAIIAVSAIMVWFRPEAVSPYRATFHALSFAMIATETGGYTETFLIYLLMMENWNGITKKISFVSAYILLIPLDISLDQLPTMAMESYLAGHAAFVNYYVSLGHFLRPLFVLIMTSSLALVSIRDVWQDVRTEGWKGRWRYRHDALQMPWMTRPSPPVARLAAEPRSTP